MKVGIFGDSFADETTHMEFAQYPSWVEVLRTKYNLDVTGFGVSGSSLYYSYKLFLDNHYRFDKIIFVATVPGRLELPSYIETNDFRVRHINSLFSAERTLETVVNMSYLARKAVEAARDHFIYLFDQEKEDILHDLMINNIKSIRPDVIMQSVNNRRDALGLMEISIKEVESHGIEHKEFGKADARICHMSRRNNEILAEKAYGWLHGAPTAINLDDFIVPKREELLRYQPL